MPEKSWFYSWQGCENFLCTKASVLGLGPTQLSIQWVLGALSPGVKWLVYEAGQSLHSAEFKNDVIIPSFP